MMNKLGQLKIYQRTPLTTSVVSGFVLILVVFLPFVINDYMIDVGTSIFTFAILGLGLNLVVGYAGLLDLGYAAFFAIGAYTSAICITKLGLNFWETIPLSMALAACSGAALGYPTLRLRSDYLAIVTLGFGEIVRITVTNLNFTGGPEGIWGIRRPKLFGFRLTGSLSVFYLALVFLLITLILTHFLTRSRIGRAWLSLREDESASEAVGVPSVKVKLLAYVMGAMWAGLAGAFFASRIGIINPGSFTYMQSVLILMVVVLGGMASTPGILVGAVVVVGLPEVLRSIQDWRLLVFSLGLVFLMLVRPQGLWPASNRKVNPFGHVLDEDLKSFVPKQAMPAGGKQGEFVLEVAHLNRSFGGIKAMNDVCFKIPRAGIVSIIGPNGAGKTTLFNCMTGVVHPDDGQVILNGTVLNGKAPHQIVKAGIARTFQGIRLFKGLAVYENVLLGLFVRQKCGVWESMLRTPRQRKEERLAFKIARYWLNFTGLEEFSGYLSSELSYGNQRRLEIARALASNPQVLLLDEPAAGMNPTEKLELMSLIRRIRELGITVIVIEHDIRFVMGLSDRIIVIDRGSKIADDVPKIVQSNQQVIEAYLGSDEEDEVEDKISEERMR